MSNDIPAIGHKGKVYQNWDELVLEESHGFVVVAVPKERSKSTGPWVVGPWATKREANNCRQRMRTKLKQVMDLEYVDFFIRHAWKDV